MRYLDFRRSDTLRSARRRLRRLWWRFRILCRSGLGSAPSSCSGGRWAVGIDPRLLIAALIF